MAKQTTLETIQVVFSVFHDGIICEFSGDENCLRLKIDCQYLAEQLDRNFRFFYVELKHITKLELVLFKNPPDKKQIYLTGVEDIFAPCLEITSAKLKTNFVEIGCDDMECEYDGGLLSLACDNILVFDHETKEIIVDELIRICKEYWDNF